MYDPLIRRRKRYVSCEGHTALGADARVASSAYQLPPPPPPPPPPLEPPENPLEPLPPGVEAIALEIWLENDDRSRDMFAAENDARLLPTYQPDVASFRSRPSKAFAH